jgi:cell division protein FtsA
MSEVETIPTIVAIDVGTHKVAVLIGRVHAADRIEVIGLGHAANRGMSKGMINNMDKVVAAIKEAVALAEDMADCRVHSAWVAIPSPELQSFNASGRTPVANGSITTAEIVRTLEMAKSSHLLPTHYLINAVPLGVAIDDREDWAEYPINMAASAITGHYHLMMLPNNIMQNIDKALKSANIGVERMIVSNLATAESTLLREEKEYGVCLVDIGAGTTAISVYLENRLILSHTLQRGGESVTRDIASVLHTSTEQAEMLKVRYGGVNRDLIRPDQMIQVAGAGNNPVLTLSRMDLADIVIARYEEIFEEVRRLLADSGAIGVLRHGVVLSGASCQIEGIVSLARNALGVPVHLGNHPASVEIREERKPLLHRTIFATASGLLLYSQSENQRWSEATDRDAGREQIVTRLMVTPWRRLVDKLRAVF